MNSLYVCVYAASVGVRKKRWWRWWW